MTPDNPPEDNRDKPFNPFEENNDFVPFGNQPAPFDNQQPPTSDQQPQFGNAPQPNYGDQSNYGNQPSYDNQPNFGGQTQGFDTAPPAYDNAPQGDQPFGGQPNEPQWNDGQQPAYGDQSVPLGAMAQPEFESDDALDEAASFDEPAQLDLGDDDTRLPWLEGDDDEEEYTGYGAGQIIMLVLLGLAALGLLVGGIWWATRDKPDAELVADGGTIAAPSGPYKTRPENPGGEPVSGSGDTRFAVAEGQSRPVQIDETAPPARPGFQSVDKSGSTPPNTAAPAAASAATSGATADTGGVGVQVGAYSTKEAAEKGWSKLVQQSDALSGVKYRIVQGQADIGTVFRLQAVPGNAAAADALCRKLKAANISCQVK